MDPTFGLIFRAVESNKPATRTNHLLRIACWASFAVYKGSAGDIA
jgi:hypothetical protein